MGSLLFVTIFNLHYAICESNVCLGQSERWSQLSFVSSHFISTWNALERSQMLLSPAGPDYFNSSPAQHWAVEKRERQIWPVWMKPCCTQCCFSLKQRNLSFLSANFPCFTPRLSLSVRLAGAQWQKAGPQKTGSHVGSCGDRFQV